jgi:hypothetical protein
MAGSVALPQPRTVSASGRIFALVPGILLAVGYAGKIIEQSIAAIALGLVYGAARVWHL